MFSSLSPLGFVGRTGLVVGFEIARYMKTKVGMIESGN